jgi:hypothetical protein
MGRSPTGNAIHRALRRHRWARTRWNTQPIAPAADNGLAAAQSSDLRATARVLWREHNLVYLDVEVDDATESALASPLATHKIG